MGKSQRSGRLLSTAFEIEIIKRRRKFTRAQTSMIKTEVHGKKALFPNSLLTERKGEKTAFSSFSRDSSTKKSTDY